MRTTPPIDQNQLRHTATEAQKQNINSEARGVDDFVPLIAQAIKVCVEFTLFSYFWRWVHRNNVRRRIRGKMA